MSDTKLDPRTTPRLRAMGMLGAGKYTVQAVCAANTANDVIDIMPLLPEWQPGVHEFNEVVLYGGQPLRCAQGHNSTDNPGQTPDAAPALWAPYHATDRAHALPWITPTGAHDAYNLDEWMVWTDGEAYQCTRNATVHGPDVLPEAWEHGVNE